MATTDGPEFVAYFRPVLQALEDAGGSARPAEVTQRIAESEHVTEAQRTELLSSGQSRFENRVHWARFYLAKAGYIDASTRGVWVITDVGRSEIHIQHSDALRLFKRVHDGFQQLQTHAPTTEIAPEALAEAEAGTEQTYRDAVLSRLQSALNDFAVACCSSRDSRASPSLGAAGTGGLMPSVSFK